MKRKLGIAASLLMASVAAFGISSHAFAQAGAGWVQLFNGQNLNGWNPIGDANWTVENGIVTANAGKGGFLVSKESYGNFQLRAEIWVDSDANSGIFIRGSDPARIGGMTSYEVNVFDKRPGPEYGTGAIVNVGKVDPMPKAGGHWNYLEIEADGPTMTIMFNGIRTVNHVRDDKHPSGVIALQYGNGIVKFRRVEIRPL